jgi:transposase
VSRTWAPQGETPVLRAPLSHDHLSVISALTQDGRLLTRTYDQPIRTPEVLRFLRHRLAQVPGKLLVLWDGAPTHTAKLVKQFLADGAAARLRLERLPAYAPELNADEGVWRYLKHVELRNLVCPTLWDLRDELRLAFARLRHKRQVLLGCIRQAGYSL